MEPDLRLLQRLQYVLNSVLLGLSPCQENQITLRHWFFGNIGCLLSSVLNWKCSFLHIRRCTVWLLSYNLSDLLEPYSPLRSLRSALKLLLNSPSFNIRTYGYRSFCVCAPRLTDFQRVLFFLVGYTIDYSQFYYFPSSSSSFLLFSLLLLIFVFPPPPPPHFYCFPPPPPPPHFYCFRSSSSSTSSFLLFSLEKAKRLKSGL